MLEEEGQRGHFLDTRTYIQSTTTRRKTAKTIYSTFAMCYVSFNVMDKESAQKNTEVRVCDLFKELRAINFV